MIIFYLFLSLTGWTRSSSTIIPGSQQAMINLTTQNTDGSADEDPHHIFSNMNVPIQSSILGYGKAITTADKSLNFICAQRDATNYQCSIMIQKSPHSRFKTGEIHYKLTGTDAAEVHKLWFYNSPQTYQFTSTDGRFKIVAKADLFSLDFVGE